VIDDAKTLWDLLDRRAQETPDAPMLIDEADRTVSFAEFRDRAERVAAGLALVDEVAHHERVSLSRAEHEGFLTLVDHAEEQLHAISLALGNLDDSVEI